MKRKKGVEAGNEARYCNRVRLTAVSLEIEDRYAAILCGNGYESFDNPNPNVTDVVEELPFSRIVVHHVECRH
jgi:hypothetical protein